MLVLILCEHAPNSQEIRRSVHAAHELHLQTAAVQSGSYYADQEHCDSDTPVGTMIIANFASLADAKAWAAADPYATAEVYTRISVYPYQRDHSHD